MAGAAVNIGVKVVGSAKAVMQLKKAKAETKNMKPLFNKAIIIIEQSEMKTFRLGGRPKWKPSVRAKGQAGQTLQDTGRLRATVTASASPHAIRQLGKNILRFGTKLPSAPVHQFGFKKRNIPKRAFLGVYKEDVKKMEKVFEKDLNHRLEVATSG